MKAMLSASALTVILLAGCQSTGAKDQGDAVQPVAAAKANTADCAKAVDAKSKAAVAEPCATTEQFINSLDLTAAQKAKALKLVRSAH